MLFEVALILPAVKLDAVPVMLVPTNADGVPRAGVTRVGEVAKTTAPLPVVEAALMAVPFPCKIPVMVVDNVKVGEVPPLEVPAKPFAVATDTDPTGALPLEAAVTKPFAFTVIEALVNEPTFEFTVASVATSD